MNDYSVLNKKLIDELRKKGIKDERVLNAFLKVPRHQFVDEVMAVRAYEDSALPIGQGQTISQPYIVALMTEALDLGKDDKILEVGTGSGFQAAILAQFSCKVFTVERNRELGVKSRDRLRKMGYENILFRIGDGTMGWPACAPYDRIITTAGATGEIPQSLLNQLADGGRMLIPSGNRTVQELLVVDKQGDSYTQKNICDVVFVPLIGKEGWKS